jgi:hypothetical protein
MEELLRQMVVNPAAVRFYHLPFKIPQFERSCAFDVVMAAPFEITERPEKDLPGRNGVFEPRACDKFSF